MTALPCGYYRVRKDRHWTVGRWLPSEGQWLLVGQYQLKVLPAYLDEIGSRVA